MSRAARVGALAAALAIGVCGTAVAAGPAKPADPSSVPGSQISFERTLPTTPHLLVTFADTPTRATALARLAGLGHGGAGAPRGRHLVGRPPRRPGRP